MDPKSPGRFLPGLIILCSVFIGIVLMAGCSSLAVLGDRSRFAGDIADKAGFSREYIKIDDFTLLTCKKITRPGGRVRIYIEGDGNAWQTKRRLSDDPTPRRPVALYLAIEDPSDNVVYIARPGQFSQNGSVSCDPVYWSSKRFSPEVVDVFNEAINKVKADAGAPDIELIGYSGGGAIVILSAARRNDVSAIYTVAGNLSSRALCSYHSVSQLDGSTDPLDVALKVAEIPQRHFVSANDDTVPVFIAESFAEKIGDQGHESVTVVAGTTHTAGWRKAWSSLINTPLYKNK